MTSRSNTDGQTEGLYIPIYNLAHMHKMHLMAPQGHLGQLALVYGQFLHFCGKVQILANIHLKLKYFTLITVFSTLILDHHDR